MIDALRCKYNMQESRERLSSMRSLKMGGVSSDIMMEGCIQLEFRHYTPLHLEFGLIISERREVRLKAFWASVSR
ncbi:hypothetical protein M5689_009760 [Euphorbia peplus]|nr:hypothetical protein M5689_009760 [Euphorbia peplus]